MPNSGRAMRTRAASTSTAENTSKDDTTWSCGTCNNPITRQEWSIWCVDCKHWHHKKCAGMSVNTIRSWGSWEWHCGCQNQGIATSGLTQAINDICLTCQGPGTSESQRTESCLTDPTQADSTGGVSEHTSISGTQMIEGTHITTPDVYSIEAQTVEPMPICSTLREIPANQLWGDTNAAICITIKRYVRHHSALAVEFIQPSFIRKRSESTYRRINETS